MNNPSMMMNRLILIPVIFLLFITLTSAQQLADPILLWPQGAPGATGESDEDKPAIIPFVPDAAQRTGTAMLVVPGGGFTIRAVDHEGVLVAQWLKDQGITAFLLRYRLRPLYSREDWVNDGQRAIQYIRAHAAEYQIAPGRVGAIGFSAGANLIADVSLNALSGTQEASDPLDRFSTRPDFLALAYGWIRIPAEEDSARVASMPPTFLYCTAEDAGNTLAMSALHDRLLRAGIPTEAHFFQNGVHGSGFALGDPILGLWPTLLFNWMRVGGFLTEKSQIPLTGIVKLDGKPLVKGMVIMTPVDRPTAPPVIVYMNNTGTGELGRFDVSQSQGPVEGKYKIEVRQDATRWISNSREPFMISMTNKQRSNTLTDEDRKAWGEYIRKRDLSPSIDKQRVFSRQHPDDKKDYVMNLKKGSDLVIEVFSK